MAKYRHRTFEMFDFLAEATAALGSRSIRLEGESAEPIEPETQTFQHLVAFRKTRVVHLKYHQPGQLDTHCSQQLRVDLAEVLDSLPNNSRVLFDFEGVTEFGAECIGELTWFNSKIRAKGGQLVLCNLESSVRAGFFPHRVRQENSSSQS